MSGISHRSYSWRIPRFSKAIKSHLQSLLVISLFHSPFQRSGVCSCSHWTQWPNPAFLVNCTMQSRLRAPVLTEQEILKHFLPVSAHVASVISGIT